MKDDLIKRLRAPVLVERDDGIRIEAADEIERLRAAMETGNYLTTNDKLSLGIERQALEIKERDDEIERLTKENDSLKLKLRELGHG